MGKKRKMPNAQISRLGVDIKEERLPAELDDVTVARNRLRGALHTLLDPRVPSSSKNDEPMKQQQQQLTKQQQLQKQKQQEQQQHKHEHQDRKPSLAARRRRRTDLSQVAYHNTYVMKLFDRSVDLAQFKEGTPLYPICRAWMANQPRNPQLRLRTPSPETKPKQEPVDEDERQANGEGDDTEDGTDSQTGNDTDPEDLVKDTHKMPPPAPPLLQRYPIIEPQYTPGLEFNFSDPEASSRDTLLKGHLARWGQVRSKWIASAAMNEERYARSGRILKAIYERAQKAFE